MLELEKLMVIGIAHMMMVGQEAAAATEDLATKMIIVNGEM